MSIQDIMKMPYMMFVLGMADAPSIDFENKKKVQNPDISANDQATVISNFLN